MAEKENLIEAETRMFWRMALQLGRACPRDGIFKHTLYEEAVDEIDTLAVMTVSDEIRRQCRQLIAVYARRRSFIAGAVIPRIRMEQSS